jgi:hypothetical protein
VTAGATLEHAPQTRPALVAPASATLPAWPLHLMIGAFPLWWAFGLTAFTGIGFAAVMVVLLLLRRRTALVPGVLPWFAFALWAIACAVQLTGMLELVGYLQRLGDILALGVAVLYYLNARERIRAVDAMGSLVVLWVSVIILGVLATRFPDVRLSSPISYLLPPNITSNDLVHQLVYPRLAEVQQPWGATEAYNRPAAPFPYANSWGAAYAILTPVVLGFLATRPARWIRRSLVVLLVVSVYPAVQTSNRGMFLAIGIAVAYAAIRLAFRGRVLALGGVIVGGALAAAFLVYSGALAGILGRQAVSDSTGTRASLYLETFEATLRSPFLGWGAPDENATIGYALGTQGQAWTIMYSFGFVGLALFFLFLIGAALRTWSAPTTAHLWLHASLVMVIPTVWFYGLGSVQLIAVGLIAAILLRSRYSQEPLR